MAIELRRVTSGGSSDFESLLREYFAAIAGEVGDQDATEAAHRFLESERSWAWVAYSGGEPAGTVSLRALHDGACELKHLYVRPEYRKQHIARVLVELVHSTAADARFADIFLDSLPSMAAAHRLYASFGYEPCERYADDHVAHKIFMRKRLGNCPVQNHP